MPWHLLAADGNAVLLYAVCIGAVAALFWFGVKGVSDFTIRVRQGRVSFRGKFPLAQHQAVARFLLHDLAARGPITIVGARSGKRLRLRFRGDLGPAEKQRIRNFFANAL